MTPVETLALIDRISPRDPDELAQLMTEDHVSTDSPASAVHGPVAMRPDYALCPDYRVSHEEISANRHVVSSLGRPAEESVGAVGPRPLLGVLSLLGAKPGK